MMQCNACGNIDAALTDHRLVTCSAEALIKADPDTNGFVQITFSIQTPTEINFREPEDSCCILIGINIVGKVEDSEDVAFKVACKIEGTFGAQQCVGAGFPPDDLFAFTMSSSRQLYPLLALYATELLTKLGYEGVKVPPFEPSKFALKQPSAKTKRRKKTESD